MNMVSTSVAIALATAAIDGISPAANATREVQMTHPTSQNQTHPYLGMWVTGDGQIRQELLANGRYDEARGNRKSAYQGRYEVNGDHIDYWDDTGFTADGEFVDDVLYHGGMIFYRER
ncbi:Atu4866 domain-containing protein [Agrobacterium rosae]|uniref:Atu4866 domain-containing protein n=1 Tax=Agrobacterium rosae TaxID=1972867 RepID=UPI003B9DDF1B